MRKLLLSSIILILFYACTPDEVMEEDIVMQNSPGISALELEVLSLINEHRAYGYTCGQDDLLPAPPVFWNSNLDEASEMHVMDMYSNNFVSHIGSDGSTPIERLDSVNYQYSYSGENVARGPATPHEAVEAFMDSPTHCAVMMSPNYTHVGIARMDTYWALNFASPR